MAYRRRLAGEAVQAGTVGILCALMAIPPAAWAAPEGAGAGNRLTAPVQRATPLTEQERVLHALNRFTFGPRPGDVETVSKMGLRAWFMQQLHPEQIDDSAFEERMKQFPAMNLSEQELARRFPSPQMIRMAERRDLALPRDPVEHAIFVDAEEAYRLRQAGIQANQQQQAAQAKLVAKNAAAQPSMGGDMAGRDMAGGMSATADQEIATGKNGKPKLKDVADPMDASEVQAVLALPPDQRVDRLVAMRPGEMLAFRAGLRAADRGKLIDGLTPQQDETVIALVEVPVRVVGAETLQTRLARDVFSERQLQAVMVDFWLNHFSVYNRKNENEPYMLPAYERQTILPHALGHFEDLLIATAQSPAMLMYLDNWESTGPNSLAASRLQRVGVFAPKIAKGAPKGINENYARELMELHTLGVNGGYTQQDVIEVAKCFTGWTIEKPFQGGGAVYDERRHEPGTKIVLGHKIKENGQKEGLQVLHILATSPSTAHFVSQKLAVRFVSDDPPASLVNKMAQTFLNTNGDIKAVLWRMFESPEFWSPQVYRAKVKTPVEFVASALRASGATVKNGMPLVQALDRLGMPIYGMQTPNGYSWKADEWVSSSALIGRMNFALVLSSNRLAGTRTDWPALLGETDPAALNNPDATTEAKLEAAILGEPATERTRETVLAQFSNPTAQQSAEEGFRAARASNAQSDDDMGARMVRAKAGRRGPMATPETPLDTMAGLLLGSPEFQKR